MDEIKKVTDTIFDEHFARATFEITYAIGLTQQPFSTEISVPLEKLESTFVPIEEAADSALWAKALDKFQIIVAEIEQNNATFEDDFLKSFKAATEDTP